MPYSVERSSDKKMIGISTSHQIIKQWRSTESYIDCMAGLIKYIHTAYGLKVLLIPNECSPSSKYNDVHVTNDILAKLPEYDGEIETLDVIRMSGMEIKNRIASCEALVASRYHSCVAALSSGVPTLVLGWHYKYDELLHWYGQDEWVLSSQNCTADKLIMKFDTFMQQLDQSCETIRARYPDVRKAVIDAGRIIFACGEKNA